MISGDHESWSWRVWSEEPAELERLVVEHFKGRRLCITAFDSGSLQPTQAERGIGWLTIGAATFSPPLSAHVEVPTDDFCEWYVLDHVPTTFPEIEVFVNYGGFTLADLERTPETFDPTWDKNLLSWLNPIQQRFWQQLRVLDPLAYVSWGDNNFVVAKDAEFVARCGV